MFYNRKGAKMVNLLMTLSRKVELGDIINLQVLRLETV